MALVRETGAHCDLGQAGLAISRKLDGALQSKMHDVTVRRHADGSAENPREVERAAPGDSRENSDFDGLVQMG
jgi:hypothetical protein